MLAPIAELRAETSGYLRQEGQMETSVIEVGDLLTAWSPDEVKRLSGEAPDIESVSVDHAAESWRISGPAASSNIFAIPLAAGVFAPWGILLTPAVGAVRMSASTVVVAINAQLLKWGRL